MARGGHKLRWTVAAALLVAVPVALATEEDSHPAVHHDPVVHHDPDVNHGHHDPVVDPAPVVHHDPIVHDEPVVGHDDPPVHHEAPHEPVHEQSDHHDETSGVDVHVEVRINPHPTHHHEALEIEMRHLPTHDPVVHHETPHHESPHHEADAAHHSGDAPHHEGDGPAVVHQAPAKAKSVKARAEVFIGDGDGNFVQADSTRISRRGRAVLRFTTRRGRSLPLDASSLRELAGRAFEVRVDGVVVASGNLPAF